MNWEWPGDEDKIKLCFYLEVSYSYLSFIIIINYYTLWTMDLLGYLMYVDIAPESIMIDNSNDGRNICICPHC